MLIEKIKEVKGKLDVQNLVVFLIILIITIIAVNTIWNEDEKEETNISKQLAEIQEEKQETQQDLEQRLETILKKIQGVGDVEVLITYSETSQLVAMYNENTKETSTEEADTEGGTRKITEVDTSKEMVYKEENGEKQPITEKVIMPKIEGAIIIARRRRKPRRKGKYNTGNRGCNWPCSP